jgi:hypothetical protein
MSDIDSIVVERNALLSRMAHNYNPTQGEINALLKREAALIAMVRHLEKAFAGDINIQRGDN